MQICLPIVTASLNDAMLSGRLRALQLSGCAMILMKSSLGLGEQQMNTSLNSCHHQIGRARFLAICSAVGLGPILLNTPALDTHTMLERRCMDVETTSQR